MVPPLRTANAITANRSKPEGVLLTIKPTASEVNDRRRRDAVRADQAACVLCLKRRRSRPDVTGTRAEQDPSWKGHTMHAATDHPVETSSAAGIERRFPGKYISLTSFKRDGTGIATPVWFVTYDGRLLVLTASESLKVKRIRRNPEVTIAPCSASGRVRGEPVPARAELLPETELHRGEQLMNRKYRTDRLLILPIYRLVQRLRRVHGAPSDAVLAITPTLQRP